MNTCPACGTTNQPDASFCASCGASLAESCASCGASLPDAARFCPSCGAPIETPSAGAEERKLVTVLFCDVKGSTSLGERLDPEHLRAVMATYFAAMRAEIEGEGGTVEKFIGDAVMAAFGVPAAHEDDPARALRAALRMRRRLHDVNLELDRAYGVTLEARIGVNTGAVIATTEPKPGEAMVTGDVVNVAARLQNEAEPGEVLVSERTARAVRGFRFEDRGSLGLKGKSELVRALALLGEDATRPERGIPGLNAPMVGRDRELELLRSLYARIADEHRPNLVTIYGDPGVGKSRLVQEFVGWAETQTPRPTVVRGRCLPYGEGITYWPLAEVLKGFAGVLDTDPPEVVLEKVRATGSRLLDEDGTPSPVRATAALAFTVGVRDPAVSFATLEPRQVRSEMHAAWRAFFSDLARGAPVIAVVEDIHWADAALLDLLQDLAERVQGGVLFLCPSRPELTQRRSDWGGGKRNVSSIGLDPLQPHDAERLVALLLSIEELPEAVRQRILERAEGNPFFLEEIVRHLIDEELIVRVGDRWRAEPGIGEVKIPDTVQGVLAARIDLLEPAEKRTLQCAAVVGRVFWPSPVRLLLNGERDQLGEVLVRLESRDLVSERLRSALGGEAEYNFKHILTRDVAYESLPRRDRARAHASVAEWLETTAGERREEFGELLAYHLEEAYRGERDDGHDADLEEDLRRRTLETLLSASESARRRFALEKAFRLLDRAQPLASSPIDRARALERRGMIALNDYRGDVAWESFREAADLRSEHVPNETLSIANACARAIEAPLRWPGSMTKIPQEEEVRRYLDMGFANLDDQDSEERVRLLTARAFCPFAFAPRREISAQEFAESREAGESAADMAMRLGRPELASAALDGASSAVITRGLYGPVLPITERRLKLAELLQSEGDVGLSARLDPWELADIYAMAAWDWSFVGDYPRALELAEKGVFGVVGVEGLRLHALAWACFAEFAMGNWDRVVDELFPLTESLLGDRKDQPPYFVANAFATNVFILGARDAAGAGSRVDQLHHLVLLDRERPTLVVSIWMAWIRSRQGRFDEAQELLEFLGSIPGQTPRPFLEQVNATTLAEAGRWDDVPAFLDASRAYAQEAELRALPAHLDRLEGRAAVAAGRLGDGIELLTAASIAFAELRARWEKACTDLALAEALLAAGRRDDARAILEPAMAVVDDLRSLKEINRGRDVLARF